VFVRYVAFKQGLAYQISLDFERVRKSEAEACFNEAVFGHNHFPPWDSHFNLFGKKISDYMMHHILRLANRRGLIFQYHTAGTSRNDPSRGNPDNMCNLFRDYPDVKFVIFHVGFPYQDILGTLAKFPNVHLDMCGMQGIHTVCVDALAEWVEYVNITRIHAFGGDCFNINSVYGEQLKVRDNTYRSLARKIDEELMDIDDAKWVAKRVLYDNPLELYKLDL